MAEPHCSKEQRPSSMIDVNNDFHRKLEELFDIATPEQSNKLKHVFGDATPPPKRGVWAAEPKTLSRGFMMTLTDGGCTVVVPSCLVWQRSSVRSLCMSP